jgi:cytochrome P450
VEEEVRARLREFIEYLKDLFERKRRVPTEDMISRMVHAEEDGEILDEEEILATVYLMFLAGHVTPVNLIGNGVVALMRPPEQLEKLKETPELLAKGLVEETLRY